MAKKAYTASDLADWFAQRTDRDAGDVITHLKIQKLLYYAQAWHLANFNARLFDEEIQAWAHGPVVPSVYKKYRGIGWDAISPPKSKINIDDKTRAYLEKVHEVYGSYSAKTLEIETHKELPWLEARGNLPPEARSDKPISDKTMRDFFAAKIGKQWPTSVAPLSRLPN